MRLFSLSVAKFTNRVMRGGAQMMALPLEFLRNEREKLCQDKDCWTTQDSTSVTMHNNNTQLFAKKSRNCVNCLIWVGISRAAICLKPFVRFLLQKALSSVQHFSVWPSVSERSVRPSPHRTRANHTQEDSGLKRPGSSFLFLSDKQIQKGEL